MKNMLFCIALVVSCLVVSAASDDSSVKTNAVPAFRVDKGKIVVDSPFDLAIGSTEYARTAGKCIRSRLDIDYMVRREGQPDMVVSNWSHSAMAVLAKPYFGVKNIHLSFYGDEKKLESYSIHHNMDKKATEQTCIDLVKKLASDFAKRYNVELDVPEPSATAAEVAQEISSDHSAHSFVHVQQYQYMHDPVTISISALVDKKMRFSIHASVWDNDLHEKRFSNLRQFNSVTVTTNYVTQTHGQTQSSKPTAAQKRRHEEAAGLRNAVKRLFSFDLDSTNKVSFIDKRRKTEWRKLPSPVEGLVEAREFGGNHSPFPFWSLTLRRPFEGGVSPEELEAAAGRIRARIESEYGNKIPPMNEKKKAGLEEVPWLKANGTPTYGDMSLMFEQGLKKQFFIGQVGDLQLDIRCHEPTYVKRNGGFAIAVKGAIIVTFSQQPSR